MSESKSDKNIKTRILNTYNEVGVIANFYGFTPIEPPEVSKDDLKLQKNFGEEAVVGEISALLNMYAKEGGSSLTTPAMFWYEKPLKGSGENKKPKKYSFSIITIGSNKSVVECLSIQCMISILKHLGHKNTRVRVNSIGDKESVSEFDRKVNIFLKKNVANFSAETKQELKTNNYAYLNEINDKEKKWEGDIPLSIDYLSEQSRNHFKDVLEFCEIMGLNYDLDHTLLGYPEWSNETVFDITSVGEKDVLVSGIKTSKLSKKIGLKKEIPVCILTANIKIVKPINQKKIKENIPLFYLVQFGPEAKIKSFQVLEQLRMANVRVLHSLAKDKLAGQMTAVQNLGIPYIVLLGQKEAFEDSVIIRSVENRHEEKIPINQISEHIKKLKIK